MARTKHADMAEISATVSGLEDMAFQIAAMAETVRMKGIGDAKPPTETIAGLSRLANVAADLAHALLVHRMQIEHVAEIQSRLHITRGQTHE